MFMNSVTTYDTIRLLIEVIVLIRVLLELINILIKFLQKNK